MSERLSAISSRLSELEGLAFNTLRLIEEVRRELEGLERERQEAPAAAPSTGWVIPGTAPLRPWAVTSGASRAPEPSAPRGDANFDSVASQDLLEPGAEPEAVDCADVEYFEPLEALQTPSTRRRAARAQAEAVHPPRYLESVKRFYVVWRAAPRHRAGVYLSLSDYRVAVTIPEPEAILNGQRFR